MSEALRPDEHIDPPIDLWPLTPGRYIPSVVEADDAPNDVAAWAADTRPGAEVLVPLSAAAERGFSASGRVDALAALDKQRAWLEAQQLRLIAQMSAAAEGPDDKDWVREEIACALRISPMSAGDRLEFARALTRLPLTMSALDHGEITVLHARVLAESVNPLPDDVVSSIEARLVQHAHETTVGDFRKAAKREVLAVMAPTPAERHQLARDERRVVFSPQPDGMEQLWALLPADRAAALRARLNADAARVEPGDTRTADQRRADALCDLAECAASRTGAGSAGGARTEVQVVVALSTLIAVDEQPAELVGHGPIPASVARLIAAGPNSTWRRLVTDDRSRLLDYGRKTYRVPADLAAHVVARDRTCTFPGCTRSAARCELDHCTDWARGGGTSAANLHALCPRHHHLKHETAWRYDEDDGDCVWTSPTGHAYRRGAATYPDDLTTAPYPVGPDPPF